MTITSSVRQIISIIILVPLARCLSAGEPLGPAVDTATVHGGELSVVFRDNSRSPDRLSGAGWLVNERHAPGCIAFTTHGGLNFERIISGHADPHNKFAPRFGTYSLHRRAGGRSVVLVRRQEDSPWCVSSTFILMFDRTYSEEDQIRFSLFKFMVPQSPPEAPKHPARDFQYVINDVEEGKEYGFKGRLVWKPFVSPEDCRDEYAKWIAGHNRPRGARGRGPRRLPVPAVRPRSGACAPRDALDRTVPIRHLAYATTHCVPVVESTLDRRLSDARHADDCR